MTIHYGGGFAARRPNGCFGNENPHTTWGRYSACCPDKMSPTQDKEDNDNWYCSGPHASDGDVPQVCSNSTWNLYYNTAFFCCDQNMEAYLAKTKNSDSLDATFGCDSRDYVNQLRSNHSDWTIDSVDPYTPPKRNRGLNKGAIAGGVVGGVCGAIIILGLIWFLLRHRRRSKASNITPGGPVPTASDAPTITDYGHQLSEIEGDNKIMGELYAPAPVRTELEADKQARQELDSEIPKNVRQGPPSELP